MEIGSLNELLAAQAESFSLYLTFDQAVRQPIFVLHSSGSTRLPEPVVMTHGSSTVMDNKNHFFLSSEREN
jgi:acyl-CoA synthetase (AMP-forming)/AMP-acid ligase II